MWQFEKPHKAGFFFENKQAFRIFVSCIRKNVESLLYKHHFFSMNSPIEIRNIAALRLADAETLYQNSRYDGAFYLAGYALELSFKAKICECLKIDDFYSTHVKSELSKVYLVHDISKLLLLSGLYTLCEAEKSTDNALMQDWSYVVKWSEKSRYDSHGTHTEGDVQNLINAVKQLMQWISRH